MSEMIKQLQAQVLDAGTQQLPLRIQGGGSKSFLGREPVGELLNIGAYKGIISYNPVELVLTAKAGTTLHEIKQVLAEQGQMLACDPPQFSEQTTLGGSFAANLSGPARPWVGSIRDHVLGIKLINGRGEHLNFGGQVMKNVAGYDVSRLQAGAMGTLGVMTEISLKVLPIPEKTLTLCWEVDAKTALELMNQKAATPKPIHAACWHAGKLYIKISGASDAVDYTKACWDGQEVDETIWQQLRDQQLDYFVPDRPLWRFSVNPTHAMALDEQMILDWGGAQRWFSGVADKAEMEEMAAQAKGQVQLFSGGDRSGEVMHTQPSALQHIHRKLKESFDPAGVFNPGRLYSWM